MLNAETVLLITKQEELITELKSVTYELLQRHLAGEPINIGREICVGKWQIEIPSEVAKVFATDVS